MKRIILLEDKNSTVKIKKDYIEFFTPNGNFVVAKKFIKAFYINKVIKIKIAQCIKLIDIAPLYFIDQNGYIKAQMQRFKNEEV